MSGNFEALVQAIFPDGYLVRTWTLTGGVSAQVTALEIGWSDGTTKKMVVRQYGERDLRADPQIVEHEFRLLQIAQTAGIPVPTPYYADRLGEIAGSPALVIDFIEGAPDFAPLDGKNTVAPLATHLAAIHRIDGTDEALAFLPRQSETYAKRIAVRPTVVDDSLLESDVRVVLERIWAPPQQNPTVLLHGDYWPGNMLWRDGHLTAIIDWEDAAVGDPLADVANARMEFFIAFGQDAMVHFTETYQSLTAFDFTLLPYWELGAALRLIVGIPHWGLDEGEEIRIRSRLRTFIEQTLHGITTSTD